MARTIDTDLEAAGGALADLEVAGVDLAEVAEVLEAEGVAAFAKSFDELLEVLARRADDLTA